MAQVYLSLGSSIDRYRHITVALDTLHQYFGSLILSPVYESESIGFDGDNFLNLVVSISCQLSVGELSSLLRGIENDHGRRRDLPKFSSKTLDIDILTYDDLTGVIDSVDLPRQEILDNAFVLLPLSMIAADNLHPQLQISYRAIWQGYDKASQKLWPVNFQWQGQKISSALSSNSKSNATYSNFSPHQQQ